MSRHTPGKWEVIKGYDGFTITGIGVPKLRFEVCRFERDSVTRDNAQLMAAASEMYDLLRLLEVELMPHEDGSGNYDLWMKVRKVLAEATGGSNG